MADKHFKKDVRIRMREGRDQAGILGTVLGETVYVEQFWVPVKWDDEEDPTFCKEAGLELHVAPAIKKPIMITKDDQGIMRKLAVQQGYVPKTCLLDGFYIMAMINTAKDPCAGCNENRFVCGGRPMEPQMKT